MTSRKDITPEIADAYRLDGRIAENAHFAGEAISRGFAHAQRMVETGGYRHLGFASPDDYARSLDWSNVRLPRADRAAASVFLTGLGLSYREAAKALGVDPKTVHRDVKVKGVANATAGADRGREKPDGNQVDTPARDDAGVANATPAGTVKVSPDVAKAGKKAVEKREKREKAKREREKAKREKAKREAAAGPGSWTVVHSDIRDLISDGHVEPESLDAVLTDPPYPREYLATWSYLADFAAAALKPGGMLAALSGQAWLPDIYARLAVDGLAYRWTMALRLPGMATDVWHHAVGCQWKPVLLYHAGGEARAPFIPSDVVDGPALAAQEDGAHKWGQSLGAQQALAERLGIGPGMRVCDPFGGGGATALGAWQLGAAVLVSDMDPVAVETLRDLSNGS